MIFPVWTLKFVNDPCGMEYDQTVIIKFLWNEGADARQIATRFQAQFAEHAYQFRTVQFWITEIRRGRQDLHDEIRRGIPPLDDLDGKILVIFDKSPFELAHSIAERLPIVHSTVLQHLYKSLGFKSFHLHWVPHLLTGDLLEKRKEYARAMLPFLHAAERDGWHHRVTGDES
jgi:predicted transposase YbfD/YdcC